MVDLLLQFNATMIYGTNFNSFVVLLIQISCDVSHDAEIYFASNAVVSLLL